MIVSSGIYAFYPYPRIKKQNVPSNQTYYHSWSTLNLTLDFFLKIFFKIPTLIPGFYLYNLSSPVNHLISACPSRINCIKLIKSKLTDYHWFILPFFLTQIFYTLQAHWQYYNSSLFPECPDNTETSTPLKIISNPLGRTTIILSNNFQSFNSLFKRLKFPSKALKTPSKLPNLTF